MKKNYLFPPYFKMIGLIMLLPTLCFGFIIYINSMLGGIMDNIIRQVNNSPYPDGIAPYAALINSGWPWLYQIIIFAFTLSFAFMAFSREKVEDEYIWKIRMNSLVFALMIDCILICVAIFTLFGMNFVTFMVFNFYLIVAIYLVTFRIAIYRAKKIIDYEK